MLASLGTLSLPVLLCVVVAAAVAGDTVGYLVGRRFGPRLLAMPLLRRHANRLAGAQERLRERGGWAVFFGRFTAFLRAVMPGIAGSSRMPWRRFATFNAMGGVIWGGGITLLGYALGGSYARALPWLGRSGVAALTIFAIVVLVAWRRRRKLSDGGAGAARVYEPDPRAARSEPCPREPVRSP
ncbi:DedA family protein [Aeromicrobium terrae]|uniref:DedA family protein n=1 Tax=Aeromicrobium terrae TaxID=2498846 RepID=UPI001E4D7F1C|nr:DedA family protein [Aeromicrobium terrae]